MNGVPRKKISFFISGHTHKPVFASLDHIDRLNKQLQKAEEENNNALINELKEELERRKTEYAGKQFHKTMAIPSYFNTGCCCFVDGDITLIEIEGDSIRLVKWQEENDQPVRIVLEQAPLTYIFEQLTN